jgi:tRNA (Thr-GGU) A37 N-methylase
VSDQERTSFWQRVRRFFAPPSGASGDERQGEERRKPPRKDARERGDVPREAPGEGPPSAPKQKTSSPDAEEPPDGPGFSTLGLEDRVVVMLLFDQIVSVEQVAAAWRHWSDEDTDTPHTLWRVVALLPGVDADTVYARAARVYAFEPVDFNMYNARALMRKHRRTFTGTQWEHMVRLNVAPVRTEYVQETGEKRWIFATHDPARPAVERLLERLTKHLSKQPDQAVHYRLRYAPKEPLEEVFDDALPAQWQHARLDPPALPRAPSGKAARKRSRRFLENVAHGSPADSSSDIAETVLRSTSGDEEQMLQDRSSSEKKNAADDDAPPVPAALFDDVLASVMKTSAQAAYLFSNEQGTLEIYHRRHRRFRHWRTESHVSADAMIDFASGRILSLRPSKNQEGVERWVGDRRMEFRPSIVPARELPDDLPAAPDTEAVIIETLQ